MLYRRTNSSYWWTRFTTPGGKEIRRSTGTEAKKDAEEYEAKLKSDLWRQARMGEKPRRTWQEAVVRWIEETAHKASHQDDLCNLRWLGKHLANSMLDEITRDVIDRIIRARRTTASGGVASASTINRMLALLRAILRRAAREWDWLEKAPAIRLVPEHTQRIRWLTRDEADRLLVELPAHLAEMVRFSLATGLRESNVTHLEWNQVDLERRIAWIHPDQAKGKRAIGVPLNTDAILVLRRCQGQHLERVFSFHGAPVEKAGTKAWKKALERAGLKGVRWHDLRHTWASWHVQSGTPLHVLQELGGWSSAAMVQRYAHLSPEHLAEYATAIETRPHTIRHTTKKAAI